MPSRTLHLTAPEQARRFRPAGCLGSGAIRWALPPGTAHGAGAAATPADGPAGDCRADCGAAAAPSGARGAEDDFRTDCRATAFAAAPITQACAADDRATHATDAAAATERHGTGCGSGFGTIAQGGAWSAEDDFRTGCGATAFAAAPITQACAADGRATHTAYAAAAEGSPDADGRDEWADTVPLAQAVRRARRARRLRLAALVLAVWAIAACIGLTIAVCRLSVRLARLEAAAAASLPNAGAERPEIFAPRTDASGAPGAPAPRADSAAGGDAAASAAASARAAPAQGPSDDSALYSAPAAPAFPSRLV